MILAPHEGRFNVQDPHHMTPLFAVAYVSSAVRRCTPAELDDLLEDARAFNESVGVTGALLYQGGTFFQYFEGPKDSVEQVYARIRKSRLHHGLIELFNQEVPRRYFSTWSMGFAEPPMTELQAISQSSWEAQCVNAEVPPGRAPGVELLLAFWERMQGWR